MEAVAGDAAAGPRTRSRLTAAGFWLAVVMAVLIGLSSLRYLTGNPLVAGEGVRASMEANGWIFVAHAGASALALMLGGFQFVGAIRRRVPGLHRWSGRLYVACCVIGAASALWIAPDAESGRVAAFGFSLLAAVWLYTTLTAWRLAMQGDFAAHRRWMIRSFALTFGAVTLRLQIAASLVLGFGGYSEISPVLAYSAWVPNLAVVEFAFLIAAVVAARRAAA